MRILAPWCRGVFFSACLLAVGALASAQEKSAPPQKGEKKAATVIIKCVSDAVLTIDGENSTQTGETRKFVTPPLAPTTKRYYYGVTAVWEPNNYTKITRKRKVYVKPGETVTVDLTKEDLKQPDDILVRYVPTPQVVVDAMLQMGKVGKGDVVFDLGCGDGRIPVTAVAKFHAKRGVGIDIDPERIKESKQNAKDAKVEDKTEFRQQDVLKIKDISEATVVTLYMGEDLNRQLRPILEKTLKPGTRIVSHRFKLGDWKPERSQTLDVGGVPYDIHLWTIKKKDK